MRSFSFVKILPGSAQMERRAKQMDKEIRKEQIREANRLDDMAEESESIGDKLALFDGANAIRKRIMPIGDYTGHCPECGERVTMTANYCHSCGQRLPKHNWRL